MSTDETLIVTIHDACPKFSTRIFTLADEMERLDVNFNIALVPFFNEKEDLPRFPEFIDKIQSYKKCDVALHGLYHEKRNGEFDDFHTVTKAQAEEEIRDGLEIFEETSLQKPKVFIPPAWKLNDNTIETLEKLMFSLSETQERLIVISNGVYKKITVPKVFNWDSTGYPEKNTINIKRDEHLFQVLLRQIPPIMRVALHPRDPPNAIEDQRDMILKLVEIGYKTERYLEFISHMQKLLQDGYIQEDLHS